jgi:enamine deaminase RidA (YjgF/YER057c/UK114 family)
MEGRRWHRDGSAFEQQAAYARAVRAGGLIAVSGTAALDGAGRALAPGDAYEQARIALGRALAAIEQLGGSAADVVRTRLYLTPEADWRAAVRAHGEAFAGIDPANTTLVVAGLLPQDALVEVELDAVLAEGAR